MKKYNKIFINKKILKNINKKNINKKGIERAALLHGYEINKIKKWESRHPKPNEKELKQDLFPEELILGWESSRDIALQHIRNILIIKYYKIIPKENMWYDVAIYKNEHTGKLYNYNNPDPSIYGHIPQEKDNPNIYMSLRNKFLKIKKTGNNIIKINLYDNLGNMRYMCAA